MKSDYVSVRWTGFIKVDSADSYVFSVHANDGVRLYVDQKLIIDELSSVTDEVSGHRLISEPVVLPPHGTVGDNAQGQGFIWEDIPGLGG